MNSNYDKLVHGEYCFELPSVILSLVPSLFWKVKWSEFRGALHIVTKHFSWKLDTLEGKSLCYVIFYNDPAYISKNNFSVNFPLKCPIYTLENICIKDFVINALLLKAVIHIKDDQFKFCDVWYASSLISRYTTLWIYK